MFAQNQGDVIVDIVLERILSLIPKKENGDFKHGALKEFANTLGLKSGNLISDWMNGRSNSYKNYIYEISEKYNVPIAWLAGEINIKEKAAPVSGSDLPNDIKEIMSYFVKLNFDEKQELINFARYLIQKREEPKE